MKTLICILITLFTISTFAYVVPTYRDIKPASQAILENQNFGTPVAVSTTRLKSAFAGPTSAAAVTLTSFTLQPDVPRNLTITPGGTTGDVESCAIVVSGKNYFGRAITETFSFAADASTATVGTKAFKSVDSVVWPANCESGGFAATWSIGVGDKIGLKNCLANAGMWFHSVFNGAKEATAATVTADSDEVEKNVAVFNGTMNGTNTFTAFFVQNFACLP